MRKRKLERVVVVGTIVKEEQELETLLEQVSSKKLREICLNLTENTKKKIVGCLHGIMYDELGWR